MGYIINYSYKDKPFERSCNWSRVFPERSLRDVVFTDRAQAEKEAALQNKSMGRLYHYTVVSEDEEFPMGASAVWVDETINFPCTAAEEMRGKLVRDEEEKEPLTLEEDVVDDYLTLENNGERLVLDSGDQQLVIADSEFHSKLDIREFAKDVRSVLESLVYTYADKLKSKISDELKSSKPESQSGWVVVDTTWKRGPLHFSKDRYLVTANSISKDHSPTVFASEQHAQAAIESTCRYQIKYPWTYNNYVAVQVL
jgi:hypothetical protein